MAFAVAERCEPGRGWQNEPVHYRRYRIHPHGVQRDEGALVPSGQVDAVDEPLSPLPERGYVYRTAWKLLTGDIDSNLCANFNFT